MSDGYTPRQPGRGEDDPEEPARGRPWGDDREDLPPDVGVVEPDEPVVRTTDPDEDLHP